MSLKNYLCDEYHIMNIHMCVRNSSVSKSHIG